MRSARFQHGYAFDPCYGYSLERLLAVEPPPECEDFAPFWQARYRRALDVDPRPRLDGSWISPSGHRIQDIRYASTDGVDIGGWLLAPLDGTVERGLVVGHGYGGRDGPDAQLPIGNAAYLFPCFRGLSRSRRADISDQPNYHVLHDIDKPARYIVGGCAEDIWLGASALLELFPQIAGRLGYMGISLGGGIGAMALAWDERFRRAHLNVPTFGHQALRLTLPTVGSGAAVRDFEARCGHVMETLKYYDAAMAARHIAIPMHMACALFDPAVAPPGQFAVHNALAGPKTLFVLEAGHFDHPGRYAQECALFEQLRGFFEPL
jgi:cephalosporin-C deacetylase